MVSCRKYKCPIRNWNEIFGLEKLRNLKYKPIQKIYIVKLLLMTIGRKQSNKWGGRDFWCFSNWTCRGFATWGFATIDFFTYNIYIYIYILYSNAITLFWDEFETISLIFHLTKKVMSKFFCALCRFTTSDVNIRLISIVFRN